MHISADTKYFVVKELQKKGYAVNAYGDSKIDIEVKYNEYDNISLEEEHNLKTRILACYEIISGFKSTEMIKELVGCTLVTNPIRKTNLILKQPDFQRAVSLPRHRLGKHRA